MIKLSGASRRYQMGEALVDALHPTDLRIGPGELVVFLGPSGSGKTTLLNLIGCMDSPSSGSVTVNGVDLSAADRSQQVTYRRNSVGVVFQFHNLIPNLTARENVELAADLAQRNGTSVDDALAQVGLSGRSRHFPHEMSGGEQQRVAIARALVKDPPIVLGDEPTGNLDAASGKTVLTLFHDIHARGKCVLLVTHNAAVAQMATRVIEMRDGRIRSDVVNERPLHPDQIDW